MKVDEMKDVLTRRFHRWLERVQTDIVIDNDMSPEFTFEVTISGDSHSLLGFETANVDVKESVDERID